MAQGYYTLQEAAQVLGISVDELKQMAQKSRIRSFQDRGNLRFRTQDIQELARQRGATSDPELVLGEASLPPKKGDSPRSPKSPVLKSAGPKTPPREEVPEVFDFDMDDGSGSTDPSSVSKKAPKSSAPPKSGTSPRSGIQPRGGPVLQSKVVQPSSGGKPRSGAAQMQKPGSDSDIRLVAGTNEVMLTLAPDSDIKLREKDSGSKAPGTTSKLGGKGGTPPTSDPTAKRTSKLGGPRSPQPPDSGVRLVPMDSDSDVKIIGADEVPLGASPPAVAGDSNVRLEKVAFPPVPADVSGMMTDEINLDEEIRKEEERLEKEKPKRPSKVKPKSELKFPTTSPFELSDSDIDDARQSAGGLKDDSSDFDMAPLKEDSSNFDLPVSTDSSSEVPALKDDSSGNFKLTPERADEGSGSDDFSLELDDGETDLGGGELKAPASGISLSNPIDAGISLEKQASDDSLEFDLSLEPESTPKPAQMKQLESDDDGSSEFELSLELGDEEGGKPGKAADDSDSEFELTLDDSGDLSLEPEGTPQVKAGGDDAEAQDIFESDFDIPALQEDGAEGSATVDTELESSDFDIALDDSELAADEESGSQVVALDEEEIEAAGDEDEVEINIEEDGEFGDLEVEGDADADEEDDTRPTREVVRDRILRPAPWGPLPTIVMLPCVVVMLLVGLVGFELVQSSVAHRPPGFMTRSLNDGLVAIGLSKKMP
jgi:excisionase family DNA binding protein